MKIEEIKMIVELMAANDLTEFKIESTSGKVNIENVKSSTLDIETTSGNILCTNLEIDNVNTSSSSSSLILRFKESPSSIKVDSISGNIYLYLPREMKFMMNLEILFQHMLIVKLYCWKEIN